MIAIGNDLQLLTEISEDECFLNYEITLQNATAIELIYVYHLVNEPYIVSRTVDSDCLDKVFVSDMLASQTNVYVPDKSEMDVEKPPDSQDMENKPDTDNGVYFIEWYVPVALILVVTIAIPVIIISRWKRTQTQYI